MGLTYLYHDDTDSSPGKNPITHWMGAIVCPRRDLVVLERKKNILSLPGVEPRTAQPVPSRTMYNLLYPGIPASRVTV